MQTIQPSIHIIDNRERSLEYFFYYQLYFIFKLLGGVRTEGPASVRLYSIRRVGVVGGGPDGVWGVVPGRVWWWVVWWGAVWGEVLDGAPLGLMVGRAALGGRRGGLPLLPGLPLVEGSPRLDEGSSRFAVSAAAKEEGVVAREGDAHTHADVGA